MKRLIVALAALSFCLTVSAREKSREEICRERGGTLHRIEQIVTTTSGYTYTNVFHQCRCNDGLIISTESYRDELCLGFDSLKAADEMRLYQYDSQEFLDYDDVHSPNGLNYARLKSHIQSRRISSIHALLDSFKGEADFKQMLKLYSLMKTSESTQPGNRILMHWGKLFLGVSANPENERHKQIEVVEFLLDESDFKFRVIDFNQPEARFFDDAIAFREKNPSDSTVANCSNCHGSPARPLWESYKFWPNAYEEGQSLVSILKQGRFKYLDPHPYLLNAATGKNLAVLNYKRIAKRISADAERFNQFKYALLGTLTPCRDVESFFPEEQLKLMKERAGKDVVALREDVKRVTLEDYARRIAREAEFGTPSRTSPGDNNNDLFHLTVRDVADARFIVEGHGLSMEDWSTSGGPSGYSYGFRNNGTGYDFDDLKFEILKLVEETDPDISDYRFSPGMHESSPYTQRICSVLKGKSLNAYSK